MSLETMFFPRRTRVPLLLGGSDVGGDRFECWLLDRYGLLAQDDDADTSVLVDVRRVGRRADVELARHPSGVLPRTGDGPRTFDLGRASWRWRIPLQETLAKVRPLWDPGTPPHLPMTDETRVARAWTVRRRHFADVPEKAFATWLEEDLAAARDALRPYLSRLDGRAVMRTVEGRVPVESGVHELMDATFEPDAPLAVALDLHPRWTHALLRLARGSNRAFLEAAWHGPGALDQLLHDALGKPDGGAPTRATCRAVTASLTALSDDDGTVVDRMARGDMRETRERLDDGRSLYEAADPAEHLARTLRHVPPDWVPRDLDGWMALGGCFPAIAHAHRFAPPANVAAILDARGDWQGLLARLDQARDGDTPLASAVRDVEDVVRAYATQVVGPALAIRGRERGVELSHVARDVLTRGRRIRRLIELSRRWHGSTLARTSSDLDPTGWPRAWPDWERDGIHVTELTDGLALVSEGVELSHCVGGYGSTCRSGDGRILSVRNDAGERLSTVQVRLGGDGPAVVQHRGRGNALPPFGARDAVAAYCRAVREGTLEVDAKALAPLQGRSVGHYGYDHAVPGAWEAMRDAWAPYVPRAWRRVPVSAFADVIARPGVGMGERAWTPEPLLP